MKQLLSTFKGTLRSEKTLEFFVVALQDRAYVGLVPESSLDKAAHHLIELGGLSSSSSSTDEVASAAPESSSATPTVPLQQIQAVAGIVVGSNGDDTCAVYCAVARQSKQLLIYRIPCASFSAHTRNQGDGRDTTPVEKISPLTIHQAPKRVSGMVFACDNQPHQNAVLLTADLAGDVFAYSLTGGSTTVTAKEAADEGQLTHRRLLLGHTASMLTAVALTHQFILTADRDEKIRVTYFPTTYDIHGFLLGHTAFVAAIAIITLGNDDTSAYCLSCSGDATLRVWNVPTCRELACWDLQRPDETTVPPRVPCAMCIVSEWTTSSRTSKEEEEAEESTVVHTVVAIVYDRSTRMDLFQISIAQGTDEVHLDKRHSMELPGQPLGLASTKASLLVLLQEPHYLQSYIWKEYPQIIGGDLIATTGSPHYFCNRLAAGVPLPTAILERDHHDALKMSKNEETRGPAMLLPWNTAGRRNVHAKKRKRSHLRRRQRAGGNTEEDVKDGLDNQTPEEEEEDDDDDDKNNADTNMQGDEKVATTEDA